VKTKKICIYLLASFILFILVLNIFGIIFNTTSSIPVGIYRKTYNPIQKGEYVVFCPPNNATFKMAKQRNYIGSGLCPGNLGKMLKKIYGVAGDTISIEKIGVFVNGRLLPLSKPLTEDGENRRLDQFQEKNQILQKNELLLMTDHSSLSFDARYFGPIDKKQVSSTIEPILVW
jgi:conjugative transfer signal peptidase TraF